MNMALTSGHCLKMTNHSQTLLNPTKDVGVLYPEVDQGDSSMGSASKKELSKFSTRDGREKENPIWEGRVPNSDQWSVFGLLPVMLQRSNSAISDREKSLSKILLSVSLSRETDYHWE